MTNHTRQVIGLAITLLGVSMFLPEPVSMYVRAVGIAFGLALMFGDFKD